MEKSAASLQVRDCPLPLVYCQRAGILLGGFHGFNLPQRFETIRLSIIMPRKLDNKTPLRVCPGIGLPPGGHAQIRKTYENNIEIYWNGNIIAPSSRLKLTLWGWTPPVVDTERGALKKSYKMAGYQEM